MLTPFKKRVNNTCLIYFKSQGNLEKKEKLKNIYKNRKGHLQIP